MLTDEDEAAIATRIAAATPAPWRHEGHGAIVDVQRRLIMDIHGFNPRQEADAELVAHAPEDLMALLNERGVLCTIVTQLAETLEHPDEDPRLPLLRAMAQAALGRALDR